MSKRKTDERRAVDYSVRQVASNNRDESLRLVNECKTIGIYSYGIVLNQAEKLAAQLAAAVAEIDRLRAVCGETHQAFGAICADTEQCVRVLDNLSDAAAGDPPRHATVLPFLEEPTDSKEA